MAPRVRPSWTMSPLALSKRASSLLLAWGIPLVMLLAHINLDAESLILGYDCVALWSFRSTIGTRNEASLDGLHRAELTG